MNETLITVVEIETSGYDTSGTPFDETLFFSTHAYHPPAGGTPRDATVIEPLFHPVLASGPKIDWEVGCYTWGQDSVFNVGSIDILNINGDYTYLLDRQSKGKKMYVYLGYQDADFDTFTLVAELTQVKFIQASEEIIRQTFSDDLNELKTRALQQNMFPSTTPNTNLINQPMPLWYGKSKSIPLAMYDKPNEIWQCADVTSITNFNDGLYDNGVPLTYVASSPVPGEYTIITNADGYASVQLGGNSEGIITGDGRTTDTPKPDEVITNLLLDRYSITLESTSLSDFNTRNNYNIGVYVMSNVVGYEVLKGLLKVFNGWIHQNALGEIKLQDLREPVGYPTLFVDENNAMNKVIKEDDECPNLSDSIGFAQNFYVFDEKDLAASVSDADKQALTRRFRNIYQTEYTIDISYSHAIGACPIPSTINNSNNAQKAINKITSLYGGRRYKYSVSCIINEVAVAQLEPKDVVALSIADFGLTDPHDIDVHGVPLSYNTFLIDNDTQLTAVATEDTATTVGILDSMSTLQITGNNWKILYYPYVISEDTLLEFDFYADTSGGNSQGEILAVGVSTSSTADSTKIFQVYGTETYGIQDYNDYATPGTWKRYSIPIGQHFTGSFDYLIFVGDYDAYDGVTFIQDARFRNVRLRQDGYLHTLLVGVGLELGNDEVKITSWGG